jgi:hypothetical protein
MGWPQPKLQQRPPPPPPETRFWLTEAELSDPELLTQRLEDVRPHIERELLSQRLAPAARVKACQQNYAAAQAIGVNPIEWLSKQSDEYLRIDALLSSDEIQLLRDGKRAHHTQDQVLNVAEVAYIRRYHHASIFESDDPDRSSIPEPDRGVPSLPPCTCRICLWDLFFFFFF